MVRIAPENDWKPLKQWKKLLPFQIFAALVMAISVVGYAVSAALFLHRAGAESIPLLYVALGLVSLPISLVFYRLIDHVSRLVLMYWVLIGIALLVLGLRLLLVWQSEVVGYSIYISLSLGDLILGVLFWTLVSDYFSGLQLERYTPLFVMAMTAGGFMAGGLVQWLSDIIRTENVLFVVPLLCGCGLVQLHWLQRLVPDQGEITKLNDADFLPSIESFPRLVKRYPLILLMATQMAIAVFLWGLSELQFFAVYTQAFPQQENLAGFLGTLSAIFSASEIFISYYLTRPLLNRWGVQRVNLIYALTTLVSFLGVAWQPRLLTAIGVHFNYDALNSSIAQPVQTLSYSAIPRQFSGRARLVIDGLLYPLFQAISGGLLLVGQQVLTGQALSRVGIGFSIAFLVVSYLTGKSYLESMLMQLRAGSIDLSRASTRLAKLSDEYAVEVRELLASDAPDAQILGLEVAARLANPGQFLTQVQELLLRANPDVQNAIVQFLASSQQAEFQRYLRVQMVAENEGIRATVIETLITTRQTFSVTQLLFFLEDSSPLVRALACLAVWQAEAPVTAVQLAYEKAWTFLDTVVSPEADRQIRQRLLSTIQRTGDRCFIPLIRQLLLTPDVTVRAASLQTLASLAQPADRDLVALATIELNHEDGQVRAAALGLMQALQSEDVLIMAITSLEDESPLVRKQAAKTVATYGEMALPLVEAYLNAPQREVQTAAIAALGQIRTRRTEELLWHHLQSGYCLAESTLTWLQQIPLDDPSWQIPALALQDFHHQFIQQVFYVLACLGHAQTIEQIERLLASTNTADRQQALTTLASLSHRRFVQPILPLLEYLATGVSPIPVASVSHREVLDQMLTSRDRWIRIAAMITLALTHNEIPDQSLTHFDALTRQTAQTLTATLKHPHPLEKLPLSRIFFLKRVPLFEDIPLDELLLIDRSLGEKVFLSREIIFREGSWGEEIYIVFRGVIKILKRVTHKHLYPPDSLQHIEHESYRELSHLQSGDYFGELTFFDDLPRAATAIAQTDCTLLTIKRYYLQSLIKEHPEIALRMCREISLRLRQTNRYLE